MTVKELQEIFESSPQTAMGFAMPEQDGIPFPLTLAERYQPRRISDFIGLSRPKVMLSKLALSPRPCAVLFIGAPGVGKTAMAMAFAEELPGSLAHVPAQKCDVAMLESLRERFAYSPPKGKFWIGLIDECDQMTDKAQLQLLSRLDGTASLKPCMGGGFERGAQPPVIWLLTCNGNGRDQTGAPSCLLPRFLSRCMILPFPRPTDGELAGYLERLWADNDGPTVPSGYFEHMAQGDGVRDAMMRLEIDLLTGPRELPTRSTAQALSEAPGASMERIGHCLRHRSTSDLAAIRKRAAEKAWETRRAKMKAAVPKYR